MPQWRQENEGGNMNAVIVLGLLVLMLVATFPTWRYSRTWGYVPSGIAALLIAVVLILITQRAI
jgi:hypothetical protein